MKVYLFIVLSITKLFSINIEQITIDNKPFTIVNESYEEYDTKGKVMRLYKGKEQNNESLLFVFTLKERSGSCSAKVIEKGTYEINASTITLYSFWNRQGEADDAPYGARVKVYEILSTGSLKKISSRVYIEETTQNYDKDSAIKYLFTPAKTKEEKKALEKYVNNIEKKYDGKFVFSDEKNKLIKEVKNAFKRKLKSLWRSRL